MKRLRRAIYDKFEGEFELVGLVTGFYFTEAPKGTKYPYATFALVVEDVEPRFGSLGENSLIRFNFFSQQSYATQAENMADSFDAVFNECSLLVAGREFGFFQREQRMITKIDGVWQESILYRCMLDQTD